MRNGIPTTIRDWELYSGMPGAGDAARALTRALRLAIREAKKAPEHAHDSNYDRENYIDSLMVKYFYPVAGPYAKFGAIDTEPRTVFALAIERAAFGGK